MDNNNKWDELSLTEKSEIMRQAVANGITDLNEIRQTYNEYADGGSMDNPPNQLPEVEVTAQYPYEQRVIDTMNNSSPEFLERLRNNDKRSIHNPDGTSSTHVLGSADNIVFPEIMDVNGKLIDNRSMPWQSAMRYAIKNNDYIEFPTEGDARYFGEHYKKYFPKFFDNTFADGGKVAHDARYNHVTQIYQSYINQGVNPQTALELTNQKIAEKGWTGWVSGDNKRYSDVNSFTDHTIDQFNRLYPDSLKSNNFNQFFQGIEGGRTKYNPTPNIYRQHLLQTRPGVKKRINEYRRLQGQSPLSLVSPTPTPLPWEESILYKPQLPLEIPIEQPVIAADGGYLYARGGKLSQQNQRAGYAVDYFMNKGLSKVAAAGLVGNLMRESRMDPNALNPDKYGGAHGLAQFRGARWKNLQKMYGSNPTFEQQLDYIWHELNTTHKKGLQMLKSSRTVDEAAKNAFGYYEFSKGPENAIAQMAKYNKKMGYNQASGYRAMNDGITNAWVAYGKANPNAKLQGLNVNTPVLGYNRTIPNYDFTSAVDGLNVEDSIANFSGETPKFQYDLFPPNPTNYGTPIDWSTPEKKVETPTITPKKDNNGLELLALINQIYDSPKQKPLATYTPQRNNSMFVVSVPTSNDTFLDSSWFKKGGYLYDGGGKEDIYDKSAKVGNKTYPARTMLINGKETPVFLADDNRMYAVGDDRTPFEIWSQYSLPEVTVTPSKNKDKITGDYYNNSANRYYDSSYDPNGFMDFMNAATLGIGNRLSVSQDARLAKDAYDAAIGNKSWEDVTLSAILGNEGIFSNPNYNLALDIISPTLTYNAYKLPRLLRNYSLGIPNKTGRYFRIVGDASTPQGDAIADANATGIIRSNAKKVNVVQSKSGRRFTFGKEYSYPMFSKDKVWQGSTGIGESLGKTDRIIRTKADTGPTVWEESRIDFNHKNHAGIFRPNYLGDINAFPTRYAEWWERIGNNPITRYIWKRHDFDNVEFRNGGPLESDENNLLAPLAMDNVGNNVSNDTVLNIPEFLYSR